MKNYRRHIFLFLFPILIFSACASKPEISLSAEEKSAERAVARFHELFNAQNFEEIYNTADDGAKKVKSKEGLQFALAEMFEKFGQHRGSELIESKAKPLPNGATQVEQIYKSKFEKGEQSEFFMIVVRDQKAAIYQLGRPVDAQ